MRQQSAPLGKLARQEEWHGTVTVTVSSPSHVLRLFHQQRGFPRPAELSPEMHPIIYGIIGVFVILVLGPVSSPKLRSYISRAAWEPLSRILASLVTLLFLLYFDPMHPPADKRRPCSRTAARSQKPPDKCRRSAPQSTSKPS
jgi:hypothetical protein